MPGINLARSEAAERAALLSVESYNVILDLTTSPETFLAKTTVVFSCTTPGASTFIDVVAQELIKAELNGEAIDANKFDGESLFLDYLASENTRQTMRFTSIPNSKLPMPGACMPASINQI